MAAKAQRIHFIGTHAGGSLAGSFEVYHYAAGTNTDKDVWSDRDKNTTLAQPVTADAQGFVSFFADGLYKFVIKDTDGNTLATMDDYQVADATLVDLTEGTAIASASTLTIPAAGRWFHVTGSTTINDFSGTQEYIWLIFDGAVQLTHSASLILKDSRNYTTTANDVIQFFNEGSDIWRMGAVLTSEGGVEGRKGTDIASASSLTLPSDGDYFDVTGTTGITALSTRGEGAIVTLHFDSTPMLTHNASSLILQDGKDYVSKAGDELTFRSLGSGNWAEIGRKTNQEFGRLFTGPSSVGSGSTLSHSGTVTTAGSGAGDANVSGVKFYTALTLSAGDTYTVPTGEHGVVLIAEESITINGTIDASGAGSSGGSGGSGGAGGGGNGGAGGSGRDGHHQPAGGGGGGYTDGGGGSGAAGGSGGNFVVAGLIHTAGGAGGGASTAGTAASQQTGSLGMLDFPCGGWIKLGAAGGGGGGGGSGGTSGGGAGGAGGAGGGAIVLIAPTITLGSASTLNTSGSNGSNGGGHQSMDAGGGGGGGGGSAANIYIICRSFTDNGATFTQTAGSGGNASEGNGDGGAGVAGTKEIVVLA